MPQLENFVISPQVRNIPVEQRLLPENIFGWKWLFKCNVNILVVTDSTSGGFGNSASFHLGEVLDIINSDPWSHVKFNFTKAHRVAAVGDDVVGNFKFDSHELSQYSQIWLFGINREGQGNSLSDTELKELADFMDAGGGVFATGDHEDLGNAMAARVPRVRSMRRWYHPNPGPNGEPVAPDQSTDERHETLVDSGTETDPIPQTIRPKYYYRFVGGSMIFSKKVKYPHPLLCGSQGPLRYLPDHMHEGHCEVPSDLGSSVTFDGNTYEEYPEKNGHRESPCIAAHATNQVSNDEFGVVAAYDGHKVDVGRVVVDATWHHWFNYNVLPYKNASNPTHPSYEPSTVEKYRQIKEYYRNVATWLANPNLQTCIRNGGWIRVFGSSDIAITFQPLKKVKNKKQYYWQLGTFARDALGRHASQCQIIIWLWDVLRPAKELAAIFAFQEKPRPAQESIDFDITELETVVLGAAVHSAFEKFGAQHKPERLLDDNGEKFEKIFKKGCKKGVSTFMKSRQKAFTRSTSILSNL